jgi:hypothetical protein
MCRAPCSGSVSQLRQLHEEVRRSVKEVCGEAGRVHQGVATGRKRLRAAFMDHKEVCEVGGEGGRGGEGR